jgi:hypothetical protein
MSNHLSLVTDPVNRIVNVTFMGRSAEIVMPFSGEPSNTDVIAAAEEILRSNPPPSFADLTISAGALRGYTVDTNSGTGVIFVRPAASFG